jgi:hypothetical protein
VPNDIKLIFIHLGPEAPKHLWDNISGVRKRFPEVTILLVLNSPDNISKATQKGIEVFKYLATREVDDILESSSSEFDFSFRSGFWRYSLERLFALCAVHEYLGDQKVVHIESDLLMMSNFPWDVFVDLDKMCWLNFNEESDVAAILYSPTLAKTRRFYSHLISQLREDLKLTDMTVLSRIRKAHLQDYQLLPSASPSIARHNDAKPDPLIYENYQTFKGYFDPAALGMWNLGQDPRNGFGFARRFVSMPEATVNPANIKLQTFKDFTLRDQYEDTIFNLHVHSKNRKILRGSNHQNLSRYLYKGLYRNQKYLFSAPLFIELIADYYRRRKILELIGNIPIIKRLEKFALMRAFRRYLKRIKQKKA